MKRNRPTERNIESPACNAPARHTLLLLVLLALVTFAAFSQVLRNQFIDYDDSAYVTENRQVRAGLTIDGFIWAFTTPHTANWHPLTWLSLMLDRQIYGLKPWGFHLTSLLFHIANSLLLFLLLKRMTGFLWRSAFVAALFAIHPLHVESVAWAAERKDVLSTLFWILTTWAYLRYAEFPRAGRYLLVVLLFALGLMSKPMLVSLPLTLLLLDYWPLGRLGPHPQPLSVYGEERRGEVTVYGERLGVRWKLVSEKIPLFVMAAASSVVTFVVQRSAGAVGSLESLPFGVRAANAVVAYVSYIGKMVWPKGLAYFYPLAGHTLPTWEIAGAALMLAAATILAIRAARRIPYLAVGWLWFVITLVPVIGLLQVGTQGMADRYTYIPLTGLFIIIAWGIPDLLARRKAAARKIAFLGVPAALVILALTALTWIQVGYWRNSIVLFEHALASTTNNYVGHYNLGCALLRRGRPDEAIVQFREALRIYPQYARAHGRLGLALFEKGRIEDAIAEYSEALRLTPDLEGVHGNLANALLQLGKFDEAAAHYRQVLRIEPNNAITHYTLGLILIRQGKLDQAVSHFSQALRINPEFAEAHNNLGIVLAQQGKGSEAIEHFRAALRINPNHAKARHNLAVLLGKMGQLPSGARNRKEPAPTSDAETEATISRYREVLRARPDWPEANNNLAWILATHVNPRFRNAAEAVKLAERACRGAGYGQPVFLDTLAAAYAEAGRFDKAVAAAEKAVALASRTEQSGLAERIQGRLRLYRTHRPFRDSQAGRMPTVLGGDAEARQT